MLNTNSRHQNTGHSHNQTDTQHQSQRQQNFNNNNSNARPQNHTCSNNQTSSWIRNPVQLQAILVILYTDDVSIETYALLDSGSDKTNNKLHGKTLGIKSTDHIAVPISSLYGEHIITSTEVLLGIGSLNSTRPLFNLLVYATSASDFQMPNVAVEMLNSICAEYDHLNNITFPQTHDNRIGVLIGADAFIATVPLKFTTGAPGMPYGVFTQLRRTVTGPIPQKYKSNSNKQEINYNITLYNRIKNPEQEIENDMLQMFWTMEGKNLVSGKKTLTADDRKALETLKRTTTTRHNGFRYEIGLPWRDDTKLPNNYFLARTQLQSLKNRLQQESDFFVVATKPSKQTSKKDLLKRQRQPNFMNSQLWYLPRHTMKKKVRRVTNAASVYKGHHLTKLF